MNTPKMGKSLTSFFGAFKVWLMSLDGRDKREVNAKQHASQLLDICRHLEASTKAKGEYDALTAIFEGDKSTNVGLKDFKQRKSLGQLKHICIR